MLRYNRARSNTMSLLDSFIDKDKSKDYNDEMEVNRKTVFAVYDSRFSRTILRDIKDATY